MIHSSYLNSFILEIEVLLFSCQFQKYLDVYLEYYLCLVSCVALSLDMTIVTESCRVFDSVLLRISSNAMYLFLFSLQSSIVWEKPATSVVMNLHYLAELVY